MWKVLILLNLAALHCSVHSSVPSPVDVSFSSVNLRNVLQWLPGNGTSSGTNFTVQYAIYGDSFVNSKGKRVRWRSVQRCTEIVQRWCDLTVEMWDVEQGYYAKVRAVSETASSKWAMTRRFDPKSDTSFGPPLVSAEVENNSAVITLQGPIRYQPNAQAPVVSMAKLYPQMMYNLSIHNTRRGKVSHITVTSGGYKHGLMDYDTEYCFSAQAKFLSMPVLCQSSAWHCITTPPDPVIVQLQMIIVGIVVPVVVICILVVVCYLLHHYLMGKGHETPYMLYPTFFNQTMLTLDPEKFNRILISVIQPADLESAVSQAIHPERHRLIADPPPEYAAQVPLSPHDPEQPWDDTASSYGFVEVDPQHDNEKDNGVAEERHDHGAHGNLLKVRLQNSASGQSSEDRDQISDDGCSAGVYAAQAGPVHTCPKEDFEVSILKQAQACLQMNSLIRTQALADQGATHREVAGEMEDNGFPLITKDPQTGLFHLSLNPQTKKEGEVGEKMRMVDGRVAQDTRDGSHRRTMHFPYTSQNTRDMPAAHNEHNEDCFPDNCGVVRPAVRDEEKNDDEQEEDEQDEGTIFVNWDPRTRKLVVPEYGAARKGGLNWSLQGDEERESRVEEEEGVTPVTGTLLLENVFVRQVSQEEAEAQAKLETGRETGCEAKEDILTKWDLVISMDE